MQRITYCHYLYTCLCSVFAALQLSGCAQQPPAPPVTHMDLLTRAMDALPEKQPIVIVDLPSRGALSDRALIQTQGGAKADELLRDFQHLDAIGGGAFVIYSRNPAVATATVLGALNKSDTCYKALNILFTGEQQHSDEVRKATQARCAHYQYLAL